MRPKVVVVILLLAVGLLVVIALVSKTRHPQSMVSPEDIGNVLPTAVASNNLVIAQAAAPTNSVDVFTSATPVVSAAPVADTNAVAAHALYVRKRIKELNALAMNNDTQSRDTILSEVKDNPDKTIRAAALEAAIQFDDRSVVPPLQQIAAQTEDPQEKQNILDAIDYINLPSLTEFEADHPSQSTNMAPRKFPRRTPHTQQSPPSAP